MASNISDTETNQDTEIFATFSAEGKESMELPNGDFIRNAEMTREGQDLLLETTDGAVIVIEGYFSAEPSPTLHAPDDGLVLTPSLVDSFVQTAGPLQYADAGSMNDESPIGSVTEVSGDATVIRTNGASETVTIGTSIYQGDVIETSQEGAVNLQFIDETSLAVSQNAKLSIDEYVFDPSSESGSQDFSILRGLFVFTSGLIGRDDPDDVNIDTPMGSIGIRGTIIAGNADTGEITVMEGAIVLRSFDGKEMTLADMFETARFDASGGGIVHMGQTSAENFDSTFNSIKSVSPSFFSGVQQQGSGTDNNAAEGNADQTEPQKQIDGQPPQSTQPGEPQPPSSLGGDPFFGNGTDAGFDLIGPNNTGSDGTVSGPTENNTGPAAPLPPPPAGTFNPNPSTADSLPPPPNVIGSVNDGSTPPGPTLLELRTISGADGFRIFGSGSEQFGFRIAAIGDVDNDGLGNFIIAADDSTAGRAYIFDGLTPTPTGNQTLGLNNTSSADIDFAGDFDGDGTLDFVRGSPLSEGSGSGGFIISGPNVFFGSGTNAGDKIGQDVAYLGDINGDGLSDVIIGAPGTDNSMTDDGSAYIIFGSTTSTGLNASALSGTQGIKIDGSGYTGGWFGNNVSGAGDFNNDGFDDFMIAEFQSGTAGEVKLFTGDPTTANMDNVADALVNITGVGTDGNDIPLFNMGDINGDSISDIAIADTLNNEIHFLFGGGAIDTDLSDGVNNNGFTLFNSGAGELVGGNYAGDFNGDGIDDGAFIIRDGAVADVFVLYGMSTVPAGNSIDVQDLYDDPSQAFHMQYTIGHTGTFEFSIASVGDVNGDGFDDIGVGSQYAAAGDGSAAIVFGRNDHHINSDGFATHIAGQTTAMNNVIANADDQSLVGNQNNNFLDGNGMNGISFRGGMGNDVIQIDNDNFVSIDGGTGIDKIEIFGGAAIDFSSFGSEALSGIEKIAMMNNGSSVTLGMDDIFRLMHESQDIENIGSNFKTLKISDQSGGTTSLNIEDNGLTPFFTVGTPDTTFNDSGVMYDVYFDGGYALLIDQNIDTVTVV